MTRDTDEEVIDARSRLDVLLSEPLEAARHRESTTFAAIAEDRADRVVLFGAGGLGRRTLGGVRAAGIEPLAFSDNRESIWGSKVDGLEVLSPSDAAARFGSSAVFVVTIWGAGSPHRLEHSIDQLNQIGCDLVAPAAWLAWAYPDQLLPFYAMELPSKLLEQSDDVRRGFDLLADDASRNEFVAQVEWRLSGDPSALAHPVAEPQYLVTDVAELRDDDVVLDCGAYDGDTMRSWIDSRGATFRRYFALEPDPISRARLEASVADLPNDVASRITVLPYSVGGFTGPAMFSASGTLSSSLADGDGIAVDCIRLDELVDELEGETPTFLKIDIEGAELDALGAGETLIGTAYPMITIATYHQQDHLWRVPLKVSSIWPEYQCFLRPHNEQGWDLILYAVPPSRIPTP